VKKSITFLLTTFFLFIITGCTSGQRANTNPVAVAKPVKSIERPWILEDYQDKGKIDYIPSWVDAWLEGGNSLVETLAKFQNNFVFVAVNSGANFRALKQWQEGFSPDLDFARLAAVRIENRFLLSLTGYPDDEYGSYFETLIKAASDMVWDGPVLEEYFWIKRRFTGPQDDETDMFSDETAPMLSEEYVFFVLVIAEKKALIPQLADLLKSINPAPPLTRAQNNAVKRIQTDFFTGF
jgi:hypothetical protein